MTDVNPAPDPRAFWELRETPLHAMTPAQWQAYYPAMTPWLQSADPQIRECAVERLMMAVFRAEHSYIPAADPRTGQARARTAWLLGEIERAHDLHQDILPSFLRGLKYHGDDEPFRTPLLAWLDDLTRAPRPGVDADLVQGTRLLVAGSSSNVTCRIEEWLALLDHRSDYVRGCAAYQLGNFCDDETVPTAPALFAIIGSKEIDRPGIAGPFWTPQQHDIDDATWQHVTQWMLDLLERRKGAPPPLPIMPFNDIEFYLHELCCSSPELMRRMLRGGHVGLALMTATEVNGRVDGVEPVLQALAAHAEPEIAVRARNHLAAHYSKT